jgi:hypothetical protein
MRICLFKKQNPLRYTQCLAPCTHIENPSVQIKSMRKAAICLSPSYELDSTSKGIFFLIAELQTNQHTFCNICTTNPHCTENPIYEFPEMKLPGLIPNSSIYVFVRDFIFQGSVCLFGCSKMASDLGNI